jgi:hypothetical protein
VWRFLKKPKIEPPCNSFTPRHIPEECKSTYKKDNCTPMFIAALFTLAKLWNQPGYPSTGEWIFKMWYIHTVEYYLAKKKNEIMSFAGK